MTYWCNLRDKAEHIHYLRHAPLMLMEHQLYDKFSKCHIWKKLVKFLGHVVSEGRSAVDPDKVVATVNGDLGMRLMFLVF